MQELFCNGDRCHNCSATASVTISEPTAISLATSAVDPTCNAGTDGSASVTTSGGNSPYTYLWSNSATTASISGLGAGTYAVTVTDAGNCSVSASVSLTVPAAIVLTGNDVSCPGAGDGSVIASGGTAPYTYVMSNQNFSLSNAINYGSRDAEEDQSGVVRRGRSNLRIAFASNNLGNQIIGLNFPSIEHPARRHHRECFRAVYLRGYQRMSILRHWSLRVKMWNNSQIS